MNTGWIKTLLRILPDKVYIQIQYFYHFHKLPNLKNPKTFNEKLQWLKMHDRRPEYTLMVDKVLVKDYIASIIGAEHVIPTLGVWDDPDDIDFDALPEQFVLKCNHDSGSVVICRDKNSFDRAAAVKKLKKCLGKSGYWYGREWPYKNVKRKILAEPYLTDENGSELKDYKVYCFGGKPTYIQVICDRDVRETIDFYDLEWRHQPFTGLGIPGRPFPHSDSAIQPPAALEEMKRASELLSAGIPFIRVDFYCIAGKIYFGELTLYPASGYGVFEPDVWNTAFGDMLIYPE